MNTHFTATISPIVPFLTHFTSDLVGASEYKNKVLELNALAYFRFGETSGVTAIEEIEGSNGVYINAPTLGVTGLLYNDLDTAVQFDTNLSQKIDVSAIVPLLKAQTDFTVSFIFSTSRVAVNNYDNALFSFFNNSGGYLVVVGLTPAGELRIYSGGEILLGTGLNDGNKHSVTLEFSTLFDGDVYIDGVLIGFGAIPQVGNLADISKMYIGGEESSQFYTGIIDELAVFPLITGIDAGELYDLTRVPDVFISETSQVIDDVFAGKIIDILLTEGLIQSDDMYVFSYVANVTLSENLTTEQKLYLLFIEALNETVAHIDSATLTNVVSIILKEALRVDNVTATQMAMLQEVHDYLTLVDDSLLSWLLTVNESVAQIDTLTVIQRTRALVQEFLTQSDSLDKQVSIIAIINEQLVQTDSFDIKTLFNVGLHENLFLSGVIDLDGDEKYTFTFNTKTLGLSEYVGYDFNSMSDNLACNRTGIYDLTPNQDDVSLTEIVNAKIETGLINFGTSKHKQVPYAYLGLTNDGNVRLATVTIQNGSKSERWYELKQKAGSIDTRRVQLGRGVKSDLWQFVVENVDGSNFNLDEMEVLPIVLRRRI